jgi:predicted MFS family arabinose efflux permease
MRCLYAALSGLLMILAFTGALSPGYVLAIAAMNGLVRPSDIGMRNALIGLTIPAPQLVGAMGIQRITQDSARVAGSLSGAGLVALLGIGPAYAVVVGFYSTSVILTRQAAGVRATRVAAGPTRASPWRDLKEGMAYVWNTPHLLAVMLLAFLLNGTAFPLFNSLMPYVAKEVYHADQETLGIMVACGALGALSGSIALSRHGTAFRPARLMIVCALAWYAMLAVFARTEHAHLGVLVLFIAGIAQSTGLMPMSAILLRGTEPQFRGRVMGIRMLALYANLPALLLAGPLISRFGYPATATLYCAIGLTVTAFIAIRWRTCLWRSDAPSNLR